MDISEIAVPPVGGAFSDPLEILRERTAELHRRAERAGIVAAILRGTATPAGYALFLRNLLPVYETLEEGLVREPALAELADPVVFRAGAIARDLEALAGPSWEWRLPLLPAARRYRDTVRAARADSGLGLIAHAYVRYLGDLSGGQIMRTLLQRRLALPPEALGFYAFAGEPETLKARYRDALTRVLAVAGATGAVAAEAERAFVLNIALAEEVGDAAAG